MPTPQEKTPQQKLDAMLDDFQVENKTSMADPGRELHELIEKTPELKASFLKQTSPVGWVERSETHHSSNPIPVPN